ncbi:hypothetical protein BCR43DRAFT_433921 [Syncephalastrum racemosum]|uniref:EH domain-containing protein n=1 Tax=Syncephalastrum racemosum TaxID=13706 RepID=A0A1X2HMN1_SYNRA|nr:hypothetical protein BCR43DRAFT_433921 [Syncephalastrum racemosum]
MNKFKTTFLRTHHTRTTSDERRSQLFAKKLNAAQLPAFDDARPDDAPTVDLGDLSQPEQTAYFAWWKDLDPFSLGQLDIEAVRTFLSSCGLSDEKLEQIFGLFKNAPGGITESQFYAMLRLIAHAQNGRSISRDMVFLGGTCEAQWFTTYLSLIWM